MMIRGQRFNIYLMLALAVTVSILCGCRSPEKRRQKAMATLQLRAEMPSDPSGRTEEITVHRDPLIQMHVDRKIYLQDVNVEKAKVVDIVGGFALSIQFDSEGALLLEQLTGAFVGKHIAIYSQWAEPPKYELNKGKWLAAPKISKRITDGLLLFTPNVSREEAEQIAIGLNNVSKKTHRSVTSFW